MTMDCAKGWMVTLLAAAAVAGCEASFSTANISSAKLAKDKEGTQPTSVFAKTDKAFYCVVELANAVDDTRVKAVWIAVKAEGSAPNYTIDQNEIRSGSATMHFELSKQSAWPVGSYKVELYLDDKLDRTLDFKVE